jgi:spermidine synthase
MESSLFALAAAYAGVALLLASAMPRERLSAGRAGAAWALLFVALALFPFGVMERQHLTAPLRRLGDPETRIAAVVEGRSETVIYLRKELRGEPVSHQMLTGAFSMASAACQARRYMKLFVYWPIALHPDARDALLISYGIGNTAKALADTRSLEHIDVVDLSRDVLASSEVVFPDPAEHPLRDPRVHVHVEDGRYYLQTNSRRYDLITSEPPPPKHAGVTNLYTREYFQLVRDRLAPGGISSYWLPVNTLRMSDTLAIVRAWCDVFPDCSLWIGVGSSWMLIGTNEARWSRSEDDFVRQWRDPALLPELRALGLELPEQIGALFLDDAETLRERTRDVLPLVDDFPRRLVDGFPEPEDWFAYWDWMESAAARRRFAASAFIAASWPPDLRQRSLAYFEYQGMINDLVGARSQRIDPVARIERLHAVLTRTPLETLPLWLLEVDDDLLAASDRLLARGDPEALHLQALAGRAFARRDYERAATLLARLRAQLASSGAGFASRFALHREALATCLAGHPEAARATVRSAPVWPPGAAVDQSVFAWLSPRCAGAFDGDPPSDAGR